MGLLSMELENIEFMINDDFIEFSYNGNCRAWLQLPNTGDSVHTINGLNQWNWTGKEQEIYGFLSGFYYNSFDRKEYAVASAEIGNTVVSLTEVRYKNQTVYIAVDDDNNTHLLADSPYKEYYNKQFLFRKIDAMTAFELFGDNWDESEIIELSKNE
jgi:hypothetical protein